MAVAVQPWFLNQPVDLIFDTWYPTDFLSANLRHSVSAIFSHQADRRQRIHLSGDRTVAIPQSMEIDRVSDDESSPNSILNLALNSDMEEIHENVAVSREALPMLTGPMGPSYSGALVPANAGHDLVPMTRRHQQRQRKLQVCSHAY